MYRPEKPQKPLPYWLNVPDISFKNDCIKYVLDIDGYDEAIKI